MYKLDLRCKYQESSIWYTNSGITGYQRYYGIDPVVVHIAFFFIHDYHYVEMNCAIRASVILVFFVYILCNII